MTMSEAQRGKHEAAISNTQNIATLSDLLLRFVEANPEELIGKETSQEWVASMWKVRNPAAKLKKSLDEFLAVFADFDGPAVVALRDAIEPLTK
jgi:hypothetical protein